MNVVLQKPFPGFNGPWLETTDYWSHLKWLFGQSGQLIPEFNDTLWWCGYIVAREGQYEGAWAKEIALFVAAKHQGVYEETNLKVEGFVKDSDVYLRITDKNQEVLEIINLPSGSLVIKDPQGSYNCEVDFEEFLDYQEIFKYIERKIGMSVDCPPAPSFTSHISEQDTLRLISEYSQAISRGTEYSEIVGCLKDLIERILERDSTIGGRVLAEGYFMCNHFMHNKPKSDGDWEFTSGYSQTPKFSKTQAEITEEWVFDDENFQWLKNGVLAETVDVAIFEQEILGQQWFFEGYRAKSSPEAQAVWWSDKRPEPKKRSSK